MRKNKIKDTMLYTTAAVLGLVFIYMCVNMIIDSRGSAAIDTDSLSISVDSLIEEEDKPSTDMLPAAVRNFEMNLRFDNGNEIIKHYDVRGKGDNSNIYGYVQVWKAEQGLAHYLKISREYMSANVFGFREEDIKINGKTWKKWEYIVKDIAVTQGFYEEKGNITICSLCVPYLEKTYAFDKIFLELIESVIT